MRTYLYNKDLCEILKSKGITSPNNKLGYPIEIVQPVIDEVLERRKISKPVWTDRTQGGTKRGRPRKVGV